MKTTYWMILGSAFALVSHPAAAQAPASPAPTNAAPTAPAAASPAAAPHATAQSEAGEPRASISPDAVTPAAPTAPTATAAPAPAESPSTAVPTPAAAARSATQRTMQHSPASPAAGSAGTKPASADRLELGTATVTGDREQPKVMYIVPWKKSDIGDLSGKPMNSLLDEALAPVDRDEFKRQVVYYQALKADASQNGAAKQPAQQGEK